MTSYGSNALEKFDEQAKEIVRSFLAENRMVFAPYAREKAIAIHGKKTSMSPPHSVVESFAWQNYHSLVVKERD